MNWQTDSVTFQGTGHHQLEDYVLDDQNRQVIIVCDGCSSSAHVDLGARLLAHSAMKHVDLWLENGDCNRFGKTVIDHAATTLQSLDERFDSNVLDATLLMAVQEDGWLRVVVYGDGVVAARRMDGGLELYRLSCRGNAPRYLSYQLDRGRYEAHIGTYGKSSCYLERKRAGKQVQLEQVLESFTMLLFDAAQYRCLLLATDGVESFYNRADGESLGYEQVVDRFLGFRLHNGPFLRRRVARQLKTMAGQEIVPYDDLGLAALLKVDK